MNKMISGNFAAIVVRLLLLLVATLFGGAFLRGIEPVQAARDLSTHKPLDIRRENQFAPSNAIAIYLPLIVKPAPQPPTLLGVYCIGGTECFFDKQQTVNDYLLGLDSWAGLSRSNNQGHSISGTFSDIADPSAWYDIPYPAEMLWNNGYTEWINLTSNSTASAIANGSLDNSIHNWAKWYYSWVSQGRNRRAFVAPLQEMNGNWEPYGMDPGNFKAAYQRIQAIFTQENVTRSQVWWAFAPNGWSSPSTPQYSIKDYYPGDDKVDVVGFSSYNQSCRAPWMSPEQVFGPYIQEIRTTVTTSKPVFIAQTATASAGGNKDQWLRDSYAYLVQQNIRGILYFDGNKECDWSVYHNPPPVQGYKDAVSGSGFRYYAPANLSVLNLAP